uniref:Uncharacterized protein n=1 Tax=Panagrolaimus superbus TaxID=310955 RepID=A0A914Z7J3_9BILA
MYRTIPSQIPWASTTESEEESKPDLGDLIIEVPMGSLDNTINEFLADLNKPQDESVDIFPLDEEQPLEEEKPLNEEQPVKEEQPLDEEHIPR